MNLGDFINLVIGGVSERCPVQGCQDYQDHICTDDIARCFSHCQCGTE